MKRFLKKMLIIFVSFLVLSCFFSIFLVTTNTGMKTLAYLSGLYLHHPVSFKQVKGRLLDHSQWEELQFKYKDMTFQLKNLSLDWNPLALLHHELSITALHVQTLDISHNNSVYSLNDVNLKALIQPTQVNINTLQFNYSDFNFSTQGTTIQRDLPYSTQSTIHIVSNLNPAINGMIQLKGDFNLLEWQGQTNYLGDIVLKGSLSQFKTLKQTLQWHGVHWPNATQPEYSSKEGNIKIEGTWPHLQLQCDTQWSTGQQKTWQLHTTATGTMPWHWNFDGKLIPLNNSPAKEGITSSLVFSGALQDLQNGHVTFQASPGTISFIQNDALSSIPLTKGTLTATLSQKNLSGQGHLVLDTNKIIDMQFRLPQFKLQSVSPQQSFTSKITATMDSFDFISHWIPEIKNPKGLLHLVLTGQGTIREPLWETLLVVDKASADLPELGLHLNPIQLNIKSKKDHFEATGHIQSKGQTLSIKGQGVVSPNIQASVTLEGTNIPVINTHEFQVNATPKLLLHYDNNILHISGTLLVPHAVIKILSFSNSISFSRDAVYENKKSTYTPPLTTQMDVLVTMGDNVDLTAKGLHATLTGSVQIKQKPQSAISAIGELNVLKGEYKAYGQNLSIEQGELFFTGGAIDNPGINVRASKEINTETINASSTTKMLDFDSNSLQNANLRGSLTVGVEVTGRLTDPEIQLFSTPAILSQADILSMLILGRPASQANKAGGQLLLAAISSMDLGQGTNGAQLLDQLKRSLGVDFNIETNSNYNLLTNTVSDKSALVVSKSVSKRLSVGYNVGLSQTDPNVITLKYLLSKFFSVQVSTSSSNSGIDVLYTSTKK